MTSHSTLIHFFAHIHVFVQRLTSHAGIPFMEALTELLEKIMAQSLFPSRSFD